MYLLHNIKLQGFLNLRCWTVSECLNSGILASHLNIVKYPYIKGNFVEKKVKKKLNEGNYVQLNRIVPNLSCLKMDVYPGAREIEELVTGAV